MLQFERCLEGVDIRRDCVIPPIVSPAKILFIMHEERTCSGQVGQWFCKQGYDVVVKKPRWGDALPVTLEGFEAVVIFGGNMSVNDSDAYLKTEIDWLCVPFLEKKPVLGICLGAQLMVKNLGGVVQPHKDGLIEAGYFPVYPAQNSLVKNSGLLPKMVYEWHQEGFDLPSGMHCFLQGQAFKNQAVLFDDLHVGFQFHPEVTEMILRRWITLLPKMLQEDGGQPAEKQVMEHMSHYLAGRVWLSNFLKAWTSKNLV